jgi:hypothetical protein
MLDHCFARHAERAAPRQLERLERLSEAQRTAVEERQFVGVDGDMEATRDAEATYRREQVLDQIDADAPVRRGDRDAAIGAHWTELVEARLGAALRDDKGPVHAGEPHLR